MSPTLADLCHMQSAHQEKIAGTEIVCNECGLEFKGKDEIQRHINTTHKTYKPCGNMDQCEKTGCIYYHRKLKANQEICFKCGKCFMSKKDILNHIKTTHGNESCHKFLLNKCDPGQNCVFSHETPKSPNHQNQPDFHQVHTTQLHSPWVPNMSEHIQNLHQIQN